MLLRVSAACLLAGCVVCFGQQLTQNPDADGDGISDDVEAMLLEQFRPTFLIGKNDCSSRPALFVPDEAVPKVAAEDGTIYGQVFPRKAHHDEIEIHYYHLWRKDCGELGHRLDAEHVSVLVKDGSKKDGKGWRAAYWYAASHEDTVCDASQITRASTVQAQEHGARVWISSGKHASYLDERLCHFGCGGDRCTEMDQLPAAAIVNLGERSAPMNAIRWLNSREWPLAEKMLRSDFPDTRLARLEKLPASDIAWVNPEKRPQQAALLGANSGIGGVATGARATNTALVVANDSTSGALHKASQKTGRALTRTYQAVRHALSAGKQSDRQETPAAQADKR